MKIIGATVGTTTPRSNLNQTNPKKADYIIGKEILDNRIKALENDVADLKYVPIAITGITNNIGTQEIGSTFDSIQIDWTLNKDPVSQTINGEAVDIAQRSATMGKADSYTLVVTDERKKTVTATTTVTFLNGVYYGSMAYGAAIDSAAVLGLTKNLQSGKAIDFVTPGDGKRPVYALPTRYGTPTFKIGGFEYEWEKVADAFQFENASGHVESYDVWMHGQNVAGKITINVT